MIIIETLKKGRSGSLNDSSNWCILSHFEFASTNTQRRNKWIRAFGSCSVIEEFLEMIMKPIHYI